MRNSSTSTSRSVAGLKAGSARSEAKAAPLAFMYVVGLSRRTGRPCASPSVTRARSPRRKGGNPQRATSASANQKPALCRVAAYSGPGLPRPTTARKRQLSLPPLGFSAFSVFSPLAGAAPPPPLASGVAHAVGISDEVYRHLELDLLRGVDLVEIHVDDVGPDGMALDLANQRLHGLAVHREIDDGARGLDPLQRLLQGLGLELERLRVAPVAVDHGGGSAPEARPPPRALARRLPPAPRNSNRLGPRHRYSSSR